MPVNEESKLCFIIAVKYYRQYESYVKYYVDNIQEFYKDSLILLVDNNSTYIEDIRVQLKAYNNVEIIINNSSCKFEIGAYNEGIRYIITNNLLDKYEYFVFSQDTFVLKNKYDFNTLISNNIFAGSFNNTLAAPKYDFKHDSMNIEILNKINLYNVDEAYCLCWCSSFILHMSKITAYFEIVKDLIITGRHQGSTQSERFLGPILYYLNNNQHYSICGDMMSPQICGYDCWTVNIQSDNISKFFVKRVQQKNETTVD